MKRFSFFASVGIGWISLSFIVAGILWLQFGIVAAIPAILFGILLMRFYYDPDRQLPSHPLGIMSPVDGIIESVELMYDPFLERPSQRVRIKPDLMGVYHGRSPIEGKIVQYWPLLAEDMQEYTIKTTRGVWWIKTDENDDLVIVASSGFSIGRSGCEIQVGERVGQARRCGRFPTNGRIDLLLDENTYLEAVEGQRVLAGMDRIATLNHEKPPES